MTCTHMCHLGAGLTLWGFWHGCPPAPEPSMLLCVMLETPLAMPCLPCQLRNGCTISG